MKRIDLKEVKAPFNTFLSYSNTAKIHWLPFSDACRFLGLGNPWGFKPFNLSWQERNKNKFYRREI